MKHSLLKINIIKIVRIRLKHSRVPQHSIITSMMGDHSDSWLSDWQSGNPSSCTRRCFSTMFFYLEVRVNIPVITKIWYTIGVNRKKWRLIFTTTWDFCVMRRSTLCTYDQYRCTAILKVSTLGNLHKEHRKNLRSLTFKQSMMNV